MRTRKLGDLEGNRRRRLINYIRLHLDVPSDELAEDLHIARTSITTAKGNITRQLNARER